MDDKSGICTALSIAAQAMQAHALGIGVTANNIANISTSGFEPATTIYSTGSNGQGMNALSSKKANIGIKENVEDKPNIQPQSGTDLAREIPRLLSTQRSHEGNVRSIQTIDEMTGLILDTKT